MQNTIASENHRRFSERSWFIEPALKSRLILWIFSCFFAFWNCNCQFELWRNKVRLFSTVFFKTRTAMMGIFWGFSAEKITDRHWHDSLDWSKLTTRTMSMWTRQSWQIFRRWTQLIKLDVLAHSPQIPAPSSNDLHNLRFDCERKQIQYFFKDYFPEKMYEINLQFSQQ